MTPSTFAAVLAVLNGFVLLALIGLGVLGILKTRGRTRALVAGGVGVLILTRLIGPLASMILGAAGGGQASFFAGQIAVNVIIGLLTLVGVGLLIGAAIPAVRSSGPSATAPPSDRQPGYPGQQPVGWR